MENHDSEKQFEMEKYKNQANIVYINTMVFSFILSFIFFIIIDNTLIAILNFIAIIFCALAIFLNNSSRYELSSLVYISFISLVTIIEVLAFGFDPGFQYIFLSLVGLIMFTSWKPWQKFIAVALEITFATTVFFLTYGKTPPTQLSYGITSFFHISNIVLNIIAVANSANYYIFIATKAYLKVSNLARKDYLTNLMNRASFDSFIHDIFKVRRKIGQSLGILMIDIDLFKVVNDTYGHLCGDEILRQLGTILIKNIRAGDHAARYGGEEFIIIAKVKDPKQLEVLSERLRQQVEVANFKFGVGDKHITISIGALFISSQAVIDHYDALARVDKLLYRAKSEGRNCVVFESMET